MKHWPTWVEISLPNVKHNVRQIKNKIGPDVCLMVVVKADAYGHGSYEIAKAAASVGADKFGVATVDEGIMLREKGISQPILIIGLALEDAIKDIVKNDLMSTACLTSWVKALSDESVKQDKVSKVNIKINTGMNRFGIDPSEVIPFVREIEKYPNIFIEGIFTHFATPYSDKEHVEKQFALFKTVLDELAKENVDIPFKHCANSGAVINSSEIFLNQVRPGLMSTTPYPAIDPKDEMDLKECFSMKSKIVFIRELKKGETVGYDHLYRCDRDTTVAVISAGWGDGIPRELSNKGNVIIHGKRCPIRGRVMCDALFADITDIKDEVALGDEVVIIGSQGEETISCWEWRSLLGGVSSPITLRTFVTDRVTRKYIQGP